MGIVNLDSCDNIQLRDCYCSYVPKHKAVSLVRRLIVLHTTSACYACGCACVFTCICMYVYVCMYICIY